MVNGDVYVADSGAADADEGGSADCDFSRGSVFCNGGCDWDCATADVDVDDDTGFIFAVVEAGAGADFAFDGTFTGSFLLMLVDFCAL